MFKKPIFSLFFLSFLSLVLMSESIGNTESPPNTGTNSSHATPPPIAAIKEKKPTNEKCIVDEKSIEDLKKARQDLAKKSEELEIRIKEFELKEKALGEEFKKLTAIKEEIAANRIASNKESEEKVNKLVESVEAMSPKVGASLLSSIEESLAINVMSKLSTLKLSKIFQSMDPQKGSRLAEGLAGFKKAKEKTQPQEQQSALVEQKKGGEKINGNTKSNSSNENPGDVSQGKSEELRKPTGGENSKIQWDSRTVS